MTEPERDLARALERTTFRVETEPYALVGFPGPPDAEDLGLLAVLDPAQLVRDAGETTLLVPERQVERLRERHPELSVHAPLAWIRFELPMDWELVGFLARVTGALAEAGVPLGAVCGWSRDHLFVAREHLETTRDVLRTIVGTGAKAP